MAVDPARRPDRSRCLRKGSLTTSDSWLSSCLPEHDLVRKPVSRFRDHALETRIRAYGTLAARERRRRDPFSFIRTLTVGSGISPDLLDPSTGRRSRARSNALHTAGREFHPALRTTGMLPPGEETVNAQLGTNAWLVRACSEPCGWTAYDLYHSRFARLVPAGPCPNRQPFRLTAKPPCARQAGCPSRRACRPAARRPRPRSRKTTRPHRSGGSQSRSPRRPRRGR